MLVRNDHEIQLGNGSAREFIQLRLHNQISRQARFRAIHHTQPMSRAALPTWEKYASARRRARAPIACCSWLDRASTAAKRSDRAPTSPASYSQPVNFSSGAAMIVSGFAPRLVAITGHPIAWASALTRPNVSALVEAITLTRARANAAGMSSQCPTQRTWS